MLEQLTFAPSDNIENTLRYLHDECPPEGWLLSFSGGKDSLAMKEACDEVGAQYRYYQKITTVDPPELTRYVKCYHPKCIRLSPPCREPMFKGMESKGLPTRLSRWCCERYKEYPADIERGGHVLIGVRAAESPSRKERGQLVRVCMETGGFKVSPILYWTTAEVWDFLKARKAPYCELYDQGFDRIGCMGCPMAEGTKIDELLRWPWVYAKYREGARIFVERRRAAGVGFPAAWPGWVNASKVLKMMEDVGETTEQIDAQDALYRAEALVWQDAQDPEYLMRRVMAWWLECPVDYWKLEELERYAEGRNH